MAKAAAAANSRASRTSSALLKPKSSNAVGGELADLPKPNEHAVYASDLVATLGITEVEAEEMIFIADLKDAPEGEEKSIDFTEFKQVVVNWSN